MKNLSDYLKKPQNIINDLILDKQKITAIINSVVGVNIKTEDVDIKKRTIYLKVRPIIKSEVLIRKKKILNQLEHIDNIV